jgi:hypothetical protein
MPEMENPKTSRSTAKGKLTRMEKYVNDDTIDKKINDLTVGLKFLDEILKDFDKAQLRVEMMPGNVLTDEENDNERDSFERRYYDVASKILSLIQKIQNEEQEIIAATNFRSRAESNSIDDNKTSVFHFSQQKLDLHEQVDQVVTIESVISVEDELSPEERERKTHFFDTIKRDAQGPAITNLPPQNNPTDLGDFHAGIVKPFRSLESEPNIQQQFKEQNSNFMTEDLQSNQTEFVKDPKLKLENSYYLPHDAVLNKQSNSAMFDVSLITMSDSLLGGPADDLLPGSIIATPCPVELVTQNQNVKSVKNHIKRSIGLATPTFEEMYTLLTRIEAILNSRPLTPISNDPNDLEPLTPGHFLSPGESLTAVHEGDITEVKTNRLSRWQLIERMRQLFWRRWTREYLSRLQARSKWRNPDTTPAVGSLVLIADDDLPPLRWNLARITELHFGKDGLPRVASLKTKNGATKRSVHKLCVLPLEREDVHVLTHYE